jgi:N-methylhydantoinase B
MNTATRAEAAVDPIMVEVFHTRLSAIGQEAGAAIENTAISPIVTEAKDWSVTIFDGQGTLLHGTSALSSHFGAEMHAVSSTLARHSDTIADGDVFIANDPHSDGGLHPQDVVVQRPVFFDGTIVAWVAIAAHMLDMGGMVPGSSAPQATECYQEALRFPSVRLFRAGVEVVDMWEVLRTNVRSFDVIEMDLRSLVIGSHVARQKLLDLISDVGVDAFQTWSRMLDEITGNEFRRRIAALEPGTYASTLWAEIGDELLKMPCTLRVVSGSLCFDLRDAPPQVPHFVNSKPYIVRAKLVPSLRSLLGPDLPLTQSVYDAVDILTTPGSVVDSRSPAPIGKAHMDCCSAITSASLYCVQLALAASADLEVPSTAPMYDVQGTTRWSYNNDRGDRRLFTLLDGIAGGSPAGADRDGLDLARDLVGGRNSLQMADVEVLESVYPVLFLARGISRTPGGSGRFRSGSSCMTILEPYGVDVLEGTMTGTRGWCPCSGAAGGYPGALTSFRVVRASGLGEDLAVNATGVAIHAGERFELAAASGGGFGDPLDRDTSAVAGDHVDGRVDAAQARDIYGVIVGPDGVIDEPETERRRATLLRRRLEHASPPSASTPSAFDTDGDLLGEERPLFPGIVQRGGYAISIRSGAVLARAPAHWTEGCPVLEEPYPALGTVPLVLRSYLDPVTGHAFHVELVPQGEERSFSTLPDRWGML